MFATKEDKKLIYEMLISEEVIDFMFDEQHPAPTWDEFNEDEDLEEYGDGDYGKEETINLIKKIKTK